MTQLFTITGRISAVALLLTLLSGTDVRAQGTSEDAARAAATATLDTVELSDYFVLEDDPEVRWKYQFGKSPAGFIDYFLEELRLLAGIRWHVRVRTYSNGHTDTVLYRRGEDGVYHVIPAAEKSTPSMTMPRFGWVGRSWAEADRSWTYTIRSTEATLRSESQKYDDLLVIRTEEQKPPRGKTPRVYDIYFARGIGMVATVVDVTVANEANATSSVALVRLVEIERP